MPMTHDGFLELLQNAYPNAEIKLTDTAGDSDHWLLEIADEELSKKPRIAAHREIMSRYVDQNIHAVEIKLKKL